MIYILPIQGWRVHNIGANETLTTIQQYCEWANIEDLGYFLEEAAHFIFAKDKD